MKTHRRPSALLILFPVLLFSLLLAACVGGGPTQDSETPIPSPTPTPVESVEPVAQEEYTLAKEPGYNQLTLYWYKEGADYSTCDVWIWWDGKDGSGNLFHPCDYGAKCVVNVPEGITQVGFIVRSGCSDPGGASWGSATKDYEDDRFADITGPDTVIYLKPGEGGQYISTDGGTTLEQLRNFTLAGILSPREIRYFISPAARLSLDDIQVTAGGQAVAIESVSNLGNAVVTGVITLAEDLDLATAYEVSIAGYGTLPAVPTAIFDSAEFIENSTYSGDDLGAVLHGSETTFKVWAPTASQVLLNLFEAGNDCDAYQTVEMTCGDKGVWSATVPCGHGTYYTYTVTTSVGTQEAVDPYAKAVGVNGDRGMVVDLSRTDPSGFAAERFYRDINSYEDAIIWEVHVRDFSNRIEGSEYKGKYLAFTETGLTNAAGMPVGVDYLKELGVTHVHLQPVYDYATVDETRLDQPQFNWGYDPKNYNAPEGSYSTDPYHGEVRINEFKQMVQALHAAGMGVVMDVVYNHTYSLDSSFNRIVPYYYYRFNADGSAANGSGCGNETASDRVMFRKFMVDSVTYWAKEYKVDGFRFDLMALHDIETMQAIETAVHAVNPRAILYGEGWTGGSTPLSSAKQATQNNIKQVKASAGAIGAVAVFNDAIRDGLKGSVFSLADTGYISGSATRENASKVTFGLKGGTLTGAVGWTAEDAMVINYMSSHDNNTLWDKLSASCPGASTEELLAMNRLGATAVFLSRGTPFMLAGEEMLRTKGGDENSYASSDEVNNIDWEALVPGSDPCGMMEFYRALIQIRKENSFLKNAEVSCELVDGNAIEVTWQEGGETVAWAVLNPGDGELSATLPDGAWLSLLYADQRGGMPFEGQAAVPGKSVLLVRK